MAAVVCTLPACDRLSPLLTFDQCEVSTVAHVGLDQVGPLLSKVLHRGQRDCRDAFLRGQWLRCCCSCPKCCGGGDDDDDADCALFNG